MRKFFVFVAVFLIITTPNLSQSLSIKRGDKVHLIAPSRGVTKEHLSAVKKLIEDAGLIPILPKNMIDHSCCETPEDWTKNDHWSNSHTNRALNFIEAFKSDAKIIWAVCGGFGAVSVVEQLERMNFDPSTIKEPPILIGFSDITNLHLWAQKHEITSIHGMNIGQGMEMANFTGANPQGSLKEQVHILMRPPSNQKIAYELIHLNPVAGKKNMKIQSSIIGGCFSIIQRTLGTAVELNPKNKIILFEDDSCSSHYVREHSMWTQLSLAGFFDKAAALLIGDMSIDNMSTEEFVRNIIRDLNITIPVFLISDVGHGNKNKMVPLGTDATVTYGNGNTKAQIEISLP